MTLHLDSRAGSIELEGPLVAAGLAPILTILPAGDVEMVGRGPAGRPLMVGVEFKTIPDVLTCVRSGRFAEQLRGMRARYEVGWLLIEGEWRISGTGELEVRERGGWRSRGRYTYQEVASWHMTMAQRGSVLTWQTGDRDETVAWLRTLYWWWTSKDFEEHRAHLAWYTPPVTGEIALVEPTLVQRVAALLPGIGNERALAASATFGTVREMVGANAEEWQRVDGIGPRIAKRVVDAISSPASL